MSRVLPTWLEQMVGASSDPGQGTVWRLETNWSWAPWVTLLLLAFAVAWVWYFYAREGSAVGRRMKMFLIVVRLALIGLVLLMLTELMISFQRTGLPYVVVVLDDSASMGIADRFTNERYRASLAARLKKVNLDRITRLNQAKTLLVEDDAALLSAIKNDYNLKLYFLSGAARAQSGELPELVEKIKSLEPAGETSRLGDGLRSVLADLRGTPPAAIIMLTDGITVEGETLSEAATYARRKGVPLFAVGLGDEEPVRDVELSDLLVDEVVFVDDVVNFQLTVTSTGFEGREVEVTLTEKDKPEPLAKTAVTLGPDGHRQQVRLPYRPTKVGQFEYIVEVAPLKEEAQTDNNRRQRLVSVRKEQVRVLLVQAYPNFEFRYLKNLLERDTTVELEAVLQEADLEYAELDRSALPVFPVRRDELFKYDVIIFGDVNPAFLSASVMAGIRDFVEQKGGGLVFIAGPRYTPLAYRDTPLAGLLPVDLTDAAMPAGGEVVQDGFVVRPTEMGLGSPQMQLGDTPAETLKIWQQLPPLFWMLQVAKVKPAARVLAEHPTRLTPDGRPVPVICTQYVGAGKVLFHATDETWRWRYRVGDVLFARYWIQSIRYLARSKLLGGDRGAELTIDRREYQRGEPVRVRVRFVDERLAPVADDGVTLMVQEQGRQSRRMQLKRSSTSRGIFEGVLTGTSDGSYHVWMVAPTVEGRAPSADFLVTAPPGEFQRVQMDVAELAQAAETSRGKFYKITTAAALLGDLPPGRQIPIETLPPVVLWNRWWVLMIFLTLLLTEWIVRKRQGLV